MKYIKTFENIDDELDIGGYYLINYKLNLIDIKCKAKVIEKIRNLYPYEYICYIEYKNKVLKTPTWNTVSPDDVIKKISKEEGQLIDFILDTKKYNL